MHAAPWPVPGELPAAERPGSVVGPVTEVLEAVRRAKSEAQASQRAPVARCAVSAPDAAATAILSARDDLCAAGAIAELVVSPGDELAVTVELAP